MSAPTKAQLAAENAALRAKVSQLELDLHIARGNKPVPMFLRTASSLPEHMQRAKDMAMRAGITVKVSS